MLFFFAGLRSDKEREMLMQANVQHVLVDPLDYERKEGFNHILLDSGAYRKWKKGTNVSLEEYCTIMDKAECDYYISFDVIESPKDSFKNYKILRKKGYDVIPVWHFNSDIKYLNYYLKKAEIVGIGALVPFMVEKDLNMLAAIRKLCQKHPNKFHIFGICWCKAINKLKDLLFSCDSSLWLQAARRGCIIYFSPRHNYLSPVPKRFLKKPNMTREDRCIESAKNINKFLNVT